MATGGAALPWRQIGLLAAAALVVAATASAGVSTPRVWLLLLMAPLIEESLFRAGLHEALLRTALAPSLANLLTALAFGLAHALVRIDAAALVVALPALVIGLVYGRTRRVRDCVALHAAMNALWLMTQVGTTS
jgi:membrane protease YdiL (CAAX protease family)